MLQVEKQIPLCSLHLSLSAHAHLVKRPLHCYLAWKTNFYHQWWLKRIKKRKENKVQHKRTKINDSSSRRLFDISDARVVHTKKNTHTVRALSERTLLCRTFSWCVTVYRFERFFFCCCRYSTVVQSILKWKTTPTSYMLLFHYWLSAFLGFFVLWPLSGYRHMWIGFSGDNVHATSSIASSSSIIFFHSLRLLQFFTKIFLWKKKYKFHFIKVYLSSWPRSPLLRLLLLVRFWL